MPIKAFSTAPTQPIKQKDLSICLFQTRKMTFSKFLKMQMFLSTQSYVMFQQVHFQ